MDDLGVPLDPFNHQFSHQKWERDQVWAVEVLGELPFIRSSSVPCCRACRAVSLASCRRLSASGYHHQTNGLHLNQHSQSGSSRWQTHKPAQDNRMGMSYGHLVLPRQQWSTYQPIQEWRYEPGSESSHGWTKTWTCHIETLAIILYRYQFQEASRTWTTAKKGVSTAKSYEQTLIFGYTSTVLVFPYEQWSISMDRGTTGQPAGKNGRCEALPNFCHGWFGLAWPNDPE